MPSRRPRAAARTAATSAAAATFALLLAACEAPADGTVSPDAAATAGVDAGPADPCALTAGTTPTGVTAPTGCVVRDHDTSACAAARTAAGLSGPWLRFSCRVALTRTTAGGVEVVRATSDGLPTHASNYFPTADGCHETFDENFQNPNTIAAQSFTIDFPVAPGTGGAPMMTAVVGLALDGVVVFGNFAAPGDDIFTEARTFDRCGAHPQMTGVYHYHGEPLALSYDDARFIGFLRDGYPVYGRRDADDSVPTLDAFGGHTGTTPDSVTPTYHYHVNEQTSSGGATSGEQQWFLTTGDYRGTPASCSGC